MTYSLVFSSFFFFNDTATTEIYTLSLHDALPILVPLVDGLIDIYALVALQPNQRRLQQAREDLRHLGLANPGFAFQEKRPADRKSTRLNSSHANISYAVFCLKKKNKSYHY